MRRCTARFFFLFFVLFFLLQGYVTSDSDSVHDAYASHHYVPTAEEATALALVQGETDIDSGDTYNGHLLKAVKASVRGVTMADVDRALFNSLKQRFDLGLFDPPAARVVATMSALHLPAPNQATPATSILTCHSPQACSWGADATTPRGRC